MSLRFVSLLLVCCGLTGCVTNGHKTGKLVGEDSNGELMMWNFQAENGKISIHSHDAKWIRLRYDGEQKGRELIVDELLVRPDGLSTITNAVWTCKWEDAGTLSAHRKSMLYGTKDDDFLFDRIMEDRKLVTRMEVTAAPKKQFPGLRFTHRYEVETKYPVILNSGKEGAQQASRALNLLLKQYFTRLHHEHIQRCKAEKVERDWFDREGSNPQQTWTDDYELVEWRPARFMSLLVESFQHVQGAGGSGQKTGLNLWFHEGEVREVKLAELFRAGSPYVTVLGQYCLNELKRRKVAELEVRFPKGIGAEDLGVFVLQRQGLLVVFQDVAGEERVMVPWTELEVCIKPNGVVNVVRLGRK